MYYFLIGKVWVKNRVPFKKEKIILYLVTLILEINKLMMKFDRGLSMEIINTEQTIDNKNMELPYYINFSSEDDKSINIKLINYNNPKDLFDHDIKTSDLEKDLVIREWRKYTLKNIDKRVSTLKSLAPKKLQGTHKNKVLTKKEVDSDEENGN